MTESDEVLQHTTSDKGFQQLELYARDLKECYWSERQKRTELAEERLVLQFKLRELEALNKLFQAHLQEMVRTQEAYIKLKESINQLLSGKEDLRQGLQNLLSEMEIKR